MKYQLPFPAICGVIGIQKTVVFEENQMNGTHVQSNAEEKPSSPRKTEMTRTAAWEPPMGGEAQLYFWN